MDDPHLLDEFRRPHPSTLAMAWLDPTPAFTGDEMARLFDGHVVSGLARVHGEAAPIECFPVYSNPKKEEVV